MIRAWRGDRFKTRIISPQRNNSVVKIGSPQTDAQPGAGHLQRTDSHADQLGNFLSPLASLHQIFDLLDSLWRKLYLPPPTRGRGAKLGDLSHFCTLCAVFAPTSALHRSCSPITKFQFGPEIRVFSIFSANVPADAAHWPKLPTGRTCTVPPTSAHHLVPPLFIEWRVENDYKESAVNGAFYLV